MNNSINNKRSNVLTLAHKIKATGVNFGDAQKLAWAMENLKETMRNEVVSITFTKTDGTTTTRTATLHPEYLPAPKLSTTPKRKSISSKITYFEVDSNCFKSFLPTNFISYEVLPSMAVAA